MRIIKFNPNTPMMAGGDVEKLQGELWRLGYELTIDGWYGPESQTAIREFQKSNNIQVDGIVGPETRNTLKKFQNIIIDIDKNKVDHIYLERTLQKQKCTFGKLYMDFELIGYTLENRWENNQKRISRIPAGNYYAYIRDNETSKWNYDIIQLIDVPDRNHIQIHRGNFPKDTQGCILIGTEKNEDDNVVMKSKIAHDKLMNKIKNSEKNKIIIEIKNKF